MSLEKYEVNESGVYLRVGAGRELLCAPALRIVSETRDENQENWGKLLEWKDPDGHTHRHGIPARLLNSKGEELVAFLSDRGLRIPPAAARRADLLEYMFEQNPERPPTRCVTRPGWHRNGESRAFVLPSGEVVGQSELVLQNDSNSLKVGKIGTPAGWQEKVGKQCTGNSRLVLGVSAAFAAPLLEAYGMDSFGIHLFAPTSQGKTTALQVAASVTGTKPSRWRATDNALELTAAAHNHSLLCLDEVAQMLPKQIANAVYMLGNGEGKQRLTADIALRSVPAWKLIYLSSGEITLSQHLDEVGQRARGGMEVRLIEVDADAGAGMGLFENIHGAASAGAFADGLKAAVAEQSGTALPAFLQAVQGDWVGSLKNIQQSIKQFMERTQMAGAAGEVGRVQKGFALIAAAGELATEYSITGWQKGEAAKSVEKCFWDWIARRQLGSNDMRRAMEQVKAFLQQHDARFQRMNEEDNSEDWKTYSRAGFKEEKDNTVRYFIFDSVFKGEMCKGYDHRKVCVELKSRECLEFDRERHTKEKRVHGTKQRFYCIPGKILEDDTDVLGFLTNDEAAAA